MPEQAKFRFSVAEGVIELEGSEQFVGRQLAEFKDVILSLTTKASHMQHVVHAPTPLVEQTCQPLSVPPASIELPPQANDDADASPGTSYPHTFGDKNGTLTIVAKIPGATTRAKMLNTALIYCYGSFLKGIEFVPCRTIRSLCQEHGFLDVHNFSKIFKDKTMFIEDGVKGGNKLAKLTIKAQTNVKQIIEGIESSAS